MMSDQDVIELYRCLLGRAPENADTIKAFQHYYPDFSRGRQAVFRSEEFETFLADVTGRRPAGDDRPGALALALLERAGISAAPAPREQTDDTMRTGMGVLLGRLAPPIVAVVAGEAGGLALDDLLPLGPDAAILQAAPGFPPAVPLVSRLQDGAALFRLACDPAWLAGFLEERGWRVGVLALLGTPADAAWADTLRPRLAERSVVVVGRQAPALDAAAISKRITATHGGEPVLHFAGLRLHCFGGWHLPVIYTAPVPPPAFEAAQPPPGPRLALACIVRDEAVCIVNMLRSIAPLVSFYAVLDTGSTDDTVKLATEFLEASGIPHRLEVAPREAFQNRFADMRNAALAMVPDDIEWVLMLDADEEMVPEDFPAILALLARDDAEAFALPRYNFPGADKAGEMLIYPDRQIRLLRNTPAKRPRYSGAVHETVRDIRAATPPLDASALGGERGGPHIHHLVRRFRDAAQEERKQQFYRDIASQHAG